VQSILNYRTFKTQQIPLIEIQRAPLSAPERIAERALDISIEAFALACLLSMMLLVASAIRLGFTWSGYLPAASQGIQRPGIRLVVFSHERSATISASCTVMSIAKRGVGKERGDACRSAVSRRHGCDL
jgi:hypothetical protein